MEFCLVCLQTIAHFIFLVSISDQIQSVRFVYSRLTLKCKIIMYIYKLETVTQYQLIITKGYVCPYDTQF